MVHGTHNSEIDPRNKDVKVFINGEFFLREDAKISVFDSGYLIGDGVWEGMRLHNDVIVFIDLHLNRLWHSAKAIGMNLIMQEEVKAFILTSLLVDL